MYYSGSRRSRPFARHDCIHDHTARSRRSREIQNTERCRLSLLSIVQMPAGVPTATFAVGEAGATNAALFAVSMLAANGDADLSRKLEEFRAQQKEKIENSELPPP